LCRAADLQIILVRDWAGRAVMEERMPAGNIERAAPLRARMHTLAFDARQACQLSAIVTCDQIAAKRSGGVSSVNHKIRERAAYDGSR
jgi:hypothetical protein